MKTPPFELTLAGFKASALKAIAEQRLAIQHEDDLDEYVGEFGVIECLNVYPSEFFGGKECHCIIGSALPKSIGLRFSEEPIDILVKSGAVSVPGDDLPILIGLQTTHDELIQSLDLRPGFNWLDKRDAFIQTIRDLEVPAEAV